MVGGEGLGYDPPEMTGSAFLAEGVVVADKLRVVRVLGTGGMGEVYEVEHLNPEVNIELGIAGIAGNREQVKKQFSGCSEDQYTLMAIGNFNHYGSTKSCTEYNFDYDDAVLEAYKEYSDASGWAAHAY